ncbi:glutaredoxin family protein [Aquimarina sp. M1]
MKALIFTLIAICTQITQAQNKEVTIIKYKNDKNYDLYAKNLSNVTQKVDLYITSSGLKKHPEVITKSVSPKDSLLFITLEPSGGKMKFQTAYSFVPNPTKKEMAVKEKALKKNTYKKGDNINKGIVVFDKSDCPRCDRTTSYLLDNNIDFIRVQIPTNTQTKENKAPEELKENRLLLSKKMQENGIFGRYTTPVILVDGKLTHSHENLSEFLAGLRGN